MMTALYEEDFVLWTEKTAELLKRKEFNRVDWENLIEEVECMGKSERQAVESLLTQLLIHLLAVGHNHGNSYCCPTTSRNETLPLSLCFGRHSGYGGYGDFARGSRIYELNINLTTSPEDSEKSKFTLRSWVQMESGNVTELYTP